MTDTQTDSLQKNNKMPLKNPRQKCRGFLTLKIKSILDYTVRMLTAMNKSFSIKISAILLCAAIFLISAPFSHASTIDDLKAQIEQKQQELKDLEEKSKLYKDTISGSKQQQKTLKNTIISLNDQVSYLRTQIDITGNKIDQTTLFVKKIKLEIQKQEESLRLKKVYVASAIQTINDYDNTSMMELLLKNRDFSNFFSQVEHMQTVEGEIQNNIDQVQLLKSNLDDRRIEQENKEVELQDLKTDLSSQKKITDQQKNKKETLLTQTQNQEKKYTQMLNDVKKKQEQIQKDIYDFEEKLKYTIDPSTIPAARPGLFNWPADGRLSQGYGSTSSTGFINDYYTFHNGIDIANPIGTPIYAPADGKIIAIGDDGQYAYGKWIAINHENGLVTLFGHLSLQIVSPGVTVKKGQKIGYMGSTGFATGPHLHFTVYATNTFQTSQRWYGLLPLGGSINPFNYLSK